MDGRVSTTVEVVGPPPAAAHVPVEDEEDSVLLSDHDDDADLEYEYFMKHNLD
jgi:hypothetical protein